MSYTGWHLETIWVRRNAQNVIVGISQQKPENYSIEIEERLSDDARSLKIEAINRKHREAHRRWNDKQQMLKRLEHK